MIHGKGIAKLSTLFLFIFILAFAMSGCQGKPKGTIPVSGKNKSDFADMATVSIMDAVSSAQAQYPGKVIEAELEVKDGYLVWKVEIVGENRAIKELVVDAGNGAILGVKNEKDKKY